MIHGMLNMLSSKLRKNIFLSLSQEFVSSTKTVSTSLSYKDACKAMEEQDTIDHLETAAYLRISHQSLKRYVEIFDLSGCIIFRCRGAKTIYDPAAIRRLREWMFDNRKTFKHLFEHLEFDLDLREELKTLSHNS